MDNESEKPIESEKRSAFDSDTLIKTVLAVLVATVLLVVGIFLGESFPARELLHQEVADPFLPPPPPSDLPLGNLYSSGSNSSDQAEVDSEPKEPPTQEAIQAAETIRVRLWEHDLGDMIKTSAGWEALICKKEYPYRSTYTSQDCNSESMSSGFAKLTIDASTVMEGRETWGGETLKTLTRVSIINLTMPDQKKLQFLSNTHDPNNGDPLTTSQLIRLPSEPRAITIDSSSLDMVEVGFSDGSQRQYEVAHGRHGNAYLVEVVGDNKVAENFEYNLRLFYPKEFTNSNWYSQSPDRDSEFEGKHNLSPIYYDNACGFEPTFTDISFYLYKEREDDTSGITIDLNAHKIGPNPVYLTTSHYGYDPNAWGTIRRIVPIYEYLQEVISGAAINDREVELLDINGIKVRHIKPFTTGRPCDSGPEDQFQWVDQGFLFGTSIDEDVDDNTAMNVMKKIVGNTTTIE